MSSENILPRQERRAGPFTPPRVLQPGGANGECSVVTGEQGRVGKGACRNSLGQPSGSYGPLRGEAHHSASWGFGPAVGKGDAGRSQGSVNRCIWAQEEEGTPRWEGMKSGSWKEAPMDAL